MAAPRRERENRTAAPGAAVVDEQERGADQLNCSCCQPPNPLVLRPDLGTLADGSAEYALCVLHQPEPVVYRNRGDGVYVQMPELNVSPLGELTAADGTVVAGVSGDTFQRLTTIDDDDDQPPPTEGGPAPGSDPGSASRPRTFHVDLTQDDFYRGRP